MTFKNGRTPLRPFFVLAQPGTAVFLSFLLLTLTIFYDIVKSYVPLNQTEIEGSWKAASGKVSMKRKSRSIKILNQTDQHA
jgi:hypothetical protein